MRNTTGKTSDQIQISLGKHGRNRFIPIRKITIVLMVGGHGCARQAVITPAPEPPAQTSPEAMPSAPSKGTGMKKRIPITLKTGDRLGWVENALKIYPPYRFLTSLAIALNRKQAEQRSLAEPEKPFALSITGRTKMQIKAMGAFPESLGRELHKLAVNWGSHALKAALTQGRIADVTIEKTPAATFYALAVLDRQACRDQLMPLIDRQDDQMRELISRYRKAAVLIDPPNSYPRMDAFFMHGSL